MWPAQEARRVDVLAALLDPTFLIVSRSLATGMPNLRTTMLLSALRPSGCR